MIRRNPVGKLARLIKIRYLLSAIGWPVQVYICKSSAVPHYWIAKRIAAIAFMRKPKKISSSLAQKPKALPLAVVPALASPAHIMG